MLYWSFLDKLKESNYGARLYMGYFSGHAPVKRDKNSKYYEKDYNFIDTYIPYALGAGYILSSDLVHFVAKNADMLMQWFSEDVSLGTWLAPVHPNR